MLTTDKLQQFRDIFLAKKDAIIESNLQKATDAPLVEGGDEVDLIQGLAIKDLEEKLSQRDKQLISRIEAALHRIDSGKFGVCQDCEEDIAEKRLQAIPFCETCIICAEISEKEKKQYHM